MFKWLKSRIVEPSSILGAGFLIQAIMLLTKANPEHTDVIGSVFEQVATPIASGDYNSAIVIGISGLLGVFMREKAK